MVRFRCAFRLGVVSCPKARRLLPSTFSLSSERTSLVHEHEAEAAGPSKFWGLRPRVFCGLVVGLKAWGLGLGATRVMGRV